MVNEVVDDLVHNGNGGLIYKLDTEKAYDHVSWDFVDYILYRMGFGMKWRLWMKVCLITTSFAVLVNGLLHFSRDLGG